MQKIKTLKIYFVALLLAITLSPNFVYAQVTGSVDEQVQLQNQLKELQNQISQIQSQLNATTAQKKTLANKLKQLQKQQQILNLQIQATNLQVNQLGEQIGVTQNSIDSNTKKSQELQSKVAELIKQSYINDNRSFLYTALSQGQLSDVFSSYKEYAATTQSLSDIVKQLNETNNELTDQKNQLQDQQTKAQNLLSIKMIQQSQLAGSVSDQNTLLQQTKGRESDYQITLNDTKAQAAQISGRLYQLLGISGQVTFGEAYKIAKWAQGATGIDPAFLLAVITQESNLGKNVGTCNRPGDGPEKSYKVVMKPDRDIQPFLEITQSLGMNPDITPVSCAMRKKDGSQLGWGGAMGPAQFIPSTWMGYKDKVAALNGNGVANPWDIRDAFAAAAIKLVAGGADGTDQGKWNAAMRYFSGSTNTAYRFYGDNVLELTHKYQTDINSLGN